MKITVFYFIGPDVSGVVNCVEQFILKNYSTKDSVCSIEFIIIATRCS